MFWATRGNVFFIVERKTKIAQNKFIYIFMDIKKLNPYWIWVPLVQTTFSVQCSMWKHDLNLFHYESSDNKSKVLSNPLAFCHPTPFPSSLCHRFNYDFEQVSLVTLQYFNQWETFCYAQCVAKWIII